MLDNFNSKQKIIITIILIFIIGVIYFILNIKNQKENIFTEENILIENNATEISEEKDEKIIIIHITGGVKIPGIVKLPEDSRIEDAINSAGGLTEDADISNVNLAYVLEDGTKIKIPRTTDNEEIGEDQIITDGEGEALENEIFTKTTKQTNINKADEEELQQLPGIGASLAMKIVQYRNENGKFSSIEEIKNVNGIGDSKYENIKDYIKVK